MGSTEELKLTRNLTLDKMRTSNKKLLENCTQKRLRMAERYYKEVTEGFKAFEHLHIQYTLKQKKELDDPELKAVFSEASELVDLAETTFSNYKDQEDMREKIQRQEKEDADRKKREADQLVKTKQKIMAEFEEIQEVAKSYLVNIENGSATNKTVLGQEVVYLTDRLKNNVLLCDDYIGQVEPAEAAQMENDKHRAERRMRSDVFKIKSFTEEDVGSSRQSSTAPSRSSTPTRERDSFKYKKLDFPRFSGIIRNFATFKRDFKDVIQDPGCYDKKHMSHILRHECLTGDAKNLVYNIHEFDDLWKKLDDKYDDEGEVVEQITKQITSLKKVEEEDYEGLVRLVDVIERANLDLTAMGNTAVLNNPMTVRMIMMRCPRSVKENLAKELSTKKQSEEFDSTLQFLILRRKEAMRLSRLQEEKPVNRGPQGKQKGAVHTADFKKEDGRGKKFEKKGEKGWKCPVKDCGYQQKHFLSECRAFKKLAVNDRGKIILDKKMCVLCFAGGHEVGVCPRKTSGWKECDVNSCGKWHSRLLHGAVVQGLTLNVQIEEAAEAAHSRTLLLAQSIPTTTGELCTTLWDTGSTTSLVSNEFARAAQLSGSDCSFEITGVGESKKLFSTKLYLVPLVTQDGIPVNIHAFGIENITAELQHIDLGAAAEVFKLDCEQLCRPKGAVHLLIGMNYANIIPIKYEVNKKLALYKSNFGSGFVVGGILEASEEGGEQLDGFAHQVCHAVGNVRPIDFISAESFGVDIPKSCRYCRGCRECGFRAKQLTWTEAKELSVIEEGLSLDTTNKVWTAAYPFSTDPAILKNNFSQAFACMASIEKRLHKNNQIEKFNEQFEDAVNRGVFIEVSEEEQNAYNGPVNYISITESYKEGENATTPLRLCMNSSMRYQGISLNDILLKRPSSLNNIFSVLLNFRTYPVAFVKDLSKFYQSVKASERDQHLRRVLWRGGDKDQQPKVYKTGVVNFGDKPAGCMALTCVRETADLYENIDKDAAAKLKDDNYCDDVASGADDKKKAEICSLNMDKIVEMGGFRFKSTIMSGDVGEPRKILGTGWDTATDELFIEVKINTSPKRKGIRTLPNIAFEEVKENFPKVLTKRLIWRVVLGQFDLLGLASIFFIRLKLLMRSLSGEEGRKIGWDDPLPSSHRDKFTDILEMMGGIQTLRFPRCITPEGRVEGKDPEMLIFGDGSKQAFCTLAYLRWEMKGGGYKCFLISGKTRVAPLKKISVPRLELLGAVASVRLAACIQESIRIKISKRYFFTDSSCVFGMIRGECGAFQEFVGTRTGEVKNKSDPMSEWFWLPTHENLADLGTRDDITPVALHPDSAYLNGLEWMKDDFETWPVNQKPGGTIPEEEKIPAARVSLNVSITQPLLNYAKYSSFKFVTRVFARITTAYDTWKTKIGQDKSENKEDKTENREDRDILTEAENHIMFQAQQGSLQKDFTDGKLSSLQPRLQTVQTRYKTVDLIVTSGRLGAALAIGYDREYLPVINYNSPLARLIMLDAHNIDHSGVDRTLQRSRCTAWIIKGRRLAKTITRGCYTCKLRNKSLEKQVMAPLPASRLPPTPVFYSTAVDLFGPLEIRDTVKRRTSKKCWGVIFVCTKTSAVHLEVSEDYSCNSFLLCLRRFINLRGVPKPIQSDPGSQLLAAAIQLGRWDFARVRDWAAGVRTEWVKIPTDSQHFNGVAESLIKSTKKQLTANLKEKTFTKGELDTLLSNIAYIINTRPLMKKAGEDPMSGGPITPLHLLGGRATIDIPAVNMDTDPKLTKRLKFLEDVTQDFWKKWFSQVFHNLIPSYKWKTEFRNVQTGDIVLLRESNQLKAEYRLARVSEAKPGEDGKVRRIKLVYKNLHPTGTSGTKAKEDLKKSSYYETERCVQNVVVIVPVDWSQEDADAAVTQGISFK